MFEEIFRHPAANTLIVLACLMWGVGDHFLLQSHRRRQGIPSDWRLRRRPRGVGDMPWFHYNAKEWAIEASLMLGFGVSLFIATHLSYVLHLVL